MEGYIIEHLSQRKNERERESDPKKERELARDRGDVVGKGEWTRGGEWKIKREGGRRWMVGGTSGTGRVHGADD